MQTEAIADHISLELEKAQSSIYIAVAWFTNKNLFNVTLQKVQQGITVNLMLLNYYINQQKRIYYDQTLISRDLPK